MPIALRYSGAMLAVHIVTHIASAGRQVCGVDSDSKSSTRRPYTRSRGRIFTAFHGGSADSWGHRLQAARQFASSDVPDAQFAAAESCRGSRWNTIRVSAPGRRSPPRFPAMIPRSCDWQGDFEGTMHPNPRGHGAVAMLFADRVRQSTLNRDQLPDIENDEFDDDTLTPVGDP